MIGKESVVGPPLYTLAYLSGLTIIYRSLEAKQASSDLKSLKHWSKSSSFDVFQMKKNRFI